MAKPTYVSVTGKRCACEYLLRAADDPRSPIVYDATLNEYNFEYRDPSSESSEDVGKSMLRIYHCPFCGGAAPASKRELLFAVVPPEEERRLSQLLRDLKTLEEATNLFGPPDDDDPHGLVERHPERDGAAPTVESFRTLRYANVSETAEVRITESRAGRVHFWLQGKYLGAPRDEPRTGGQSE